MSRYLKNPSLAHHAENFTRESLQDDYHINGSDNNNVAPAALTQPAIIHNNSQPLMLAEEDGIDQHEEVEESLNIMDKEKELIIKALKKHRNKRRDAASDLGISERTLYRKLKEYDIDQ